MPTESVDELITELEKLKVQEASVVARLKQARERERRNSSSAGATEGNEEVFRVGDRVRITNRINPPLSRFGRNYRLDRLGTVTRVTATRVYLITDSGWETWRAHKNVAHTEE